MKNGGERETYGYQAQREGENAARNSGLDSWRQNPKFCFQLEFLGFHGGELLLNSLASILVKFYGCVKRENLISVREILGF